MDEVTVEELQCQEPGGAEAGDNKAVGDQDGGLGLSQEPGGVHALQAPGSY